MATIADLRAAHFRYQARELGYGICRVCKGKTPEDKPFCKRHFGRLLSVDTKLASDVANGERIDEAVELVKVAGLFQRQSRLSGYGKGLNIRNINGRYDVVLTRSNGHESTIASFKTIKELCTYRIENLMIWSSRNRTAKKSFIQ